jgi:hypothetical protein
MGNRIKAYSLAGYDYTKSDGLTKGVNYGIKIQKK